MYGSNGEVPLATSTLLCAGRGRARETGEQVEGLTKGGFGILRFVCGCLREG